MNQQNFLLVGATKGLGAAFAKELLKKNQKVVVIGRSVPSFSGDKNIVVIGGDLFLKKDRERCIAEIKNSVSQLDHIVFFQRFRGTPDQSLEGEYQVGVVATSEFIEALYTLITKEHGGSITAISSHAAHYVALDQSLGYHTSKAALEQLIKFYAIKLGHRNIRVNSITPSAFIKEENREFYNNNREKMAHLEGCSPLARMGSSENIIQLLLYVTGQGAGFITGQNIVIDGGCELLIHYNSLQK